MENNIKVISIKPERDQLREISNRLYGLSFGDFKGVASMKAREATAHINEAIRKLEGLE